MSGKDMTDTMDAEELSKRLKNSQKSSRGWINTIKLSSYGFMQQKYKINVPTPEEKNEEWEIHLIKRRVFR